MVNYRKVFHHTEMKLVVVLSLLLVASVTARPQGIISSLNTGLFPNNWLNSLGTILSKRMCLPGSLALCPINSKRQLNTICPAVSPSPFYIASVNGQVTVIQCPTYSNFAGGYICSCPS
ncbi:hypothetical protein Btru_063124 [Bulinus truncatus]|nr:hypothetical protein Btru_063124 [Bulinus truncatus]